MFGLCHKRFQLLVARRCSIAAAAVDSVNHFDSFEKGCLFSTSFSSKSLLGGGDEKDLSFTVSYLGSICGFSPEQVISMCKKHRRRIKSPENPDSVIKILKDYGLADAHISIIAKKRLQVLLADSKNLLPKLEFLNSIGISGNALARMLCTSPIMLSASLERSLKSFYDISTTLPIPKEKLPYLFAVHYHHKFKADEFKNVVRNVSVLRAHNVPESSFPLWQPNYLKALSFESDKVKENVNRVISMGFSPSSPTFMKALYVMSVTDESRWEQKMEFYKKWGWTEDDVLLAFRKNPIFMSLNEKNISNKLDFLLNKMGCHPADVAQRPALLTSSLERWIIPRFSVIRVLLIKGLITREEFSLGGALVMGEKKRFLDKFVIKYQDQEPELRSIFEGKIGLAKLGLGFEESGGVKQV